jgi:hypothetical protein
MGALVRGEHSLIIADGSHKDLDELRPFEIPLFAVGAVLVVSTRSRFTKSLRCKACPAGQ